MDLKRVAVALGVLTFAGAVSAAVEMGAPFSDGAVLQRDRDVPVWGFAAPGEKVSVSFAGQSVSAVADAEGRWQVSLKPLAACAEGRVLTANEVELKDVLVGEVWIASGQSNMQCPIWGPKPRFRDRNGGYMVKMTHLPDVRFVKIPRAWATCPQLKTKGGWRKFDPQGLAFEKEGDAETVSAVAFYFARELRLELGVPIGIVDASWGGTNIDAWTPRCGYENCSPKIRATADYPVKEKEVWNEKTDRKGPIKKPNQQPTVIFNGMVAPLAPLAMRGVIWYQGCNNAGDGNRYCEKMHALYNGWKKAFANERLPWLFVQLAPYTTSWPLIAAAQNRFVAEEPNAAIVDISDLGNFDDIHPNDKQPVGQRLAFLALKRHYGFDIPCADPPRLATATFKDGKVSMTFSNMRSWYVYAPDKSMDAPFEVAGTNGEWKAAAILGRLHPNAVFTSDTIEIASKEVPDPVQVRYLHQNRRHGTVYNECALPLGPLSVIKERETR